MRNLLWVGIIFVLSSACLPHTKYLPEKTHGDLSSSEQEKPVLFTQEELDRLFPEACSLPQSEGASPVSLSTADEPGEEVVVFPIAEESNDDFSLEAFNGEPPKNGQTFDIPIVINTKVEQFIQYFQTTLKKNFSNWLARSERYIPFMRNVLRENGLPEDLVYLALIESGFNPYAYSRSKASGPWQFIYLTGKRYGLKADGWVDERRDPEKSTVAAAKYLKDLYDMFECWYLAAAGYNAGERKIANAMKRYQTEDFWELTKYRYLKQETKDYVPQMIAAALIAKDPEKYGFTGIEYHEPLRYDRVEVPGGVDLRLFAEACKISVEELKELNPELLRWCTPPDTASYELKIPFGSKVDFLQNLEALRPLPRFQFRVHTVKKGESPSSIARSYRVDLDSLIELNRIKKTTRLSIGTKLLIPVRLTHDRKPTRTAKRGVPLQNTIPQPEEITYTIRSGDTLWSIAQEMGVNLGALSRWNNLHPEKKLLPGGKLRVKLNTPAPEPAQGKQKKEIIYVVKDGDSLWSIAKRFNLTIAEIRGLNNLGGIDCIHPADRLKLKVEGLRSSTLN